jgi:DNA primase
MASEERRPRVTSFYEEAVLPVVFARLPQVFPEFGWRRDARGWVATDEEFTHARFGVRAERVVAHEPHGLLIHGGEPMLWTAYLNHGTVPKGADFVRAVREIGERAGVDPSRLDRAQPPDRRADLRACFFELARSELAAPQGQAARAYLERRGFPLDAISDSDLGLVPAAETTERALKDRGYRAAEIEASGVVADNRWPGRLCGAWREEWGRIGTFWARALDDREPRYLYLRGAGRTHLPPYGLSDVLRLPSHERRELVLVEGLLDVHHLRAKGIASIAAIGSVRIQPNKLARLTRHGIETVTLALDNDEAGRDALARAIDQTSRLEHAPTLRVIPPAELGEAKDPDEYVRRHGADRLSALVRDAECGVTWRTLDRMRHLAPDSPQRERRAALADVGKWLGTLPPRLALEVEDAICAASERAGYDPNTVERAFQARFWGAGPEGRKLEPALQPTPELDHSIDL